MTQEVLKLALELLAVSTFYSPELQAKRTKVIEQGLETLAKEKALQALAQPEQEPVAWRVSPRYEDSDGYFDFTDSKDTADTLQKRGWTITPLYTTSPQRTEQELVCVCGAVWDGQELMEAPPQRTWVGLTDEEMQDLWDRYAHMEMMRAIEAELKGKNHG